MKLIFKPTKMCYTSFEEKHGELFRYEMDSYFWQSLTYCFFKSKETSLATLLWYITMDSFIYIPMLIFGWIFSWRIEW